MTPKLKVKLRLCSLESKVSTYDNNRNLSRSADLELATCGFMNYGTNVVIEGVTGSGNYVKFYIMVRLIWHAL